jgi:predicted Fe-S protein YdhL (DUF1289 family)
MPDARADASPNSPCTKVCILRADNICIGCFRHLSEIATWTAMTARERRHVLEVAGTRRLAAAAAGG